jgi:cell division protein ZapD
MADKGLLGIAMQQKTHWFEQPTNEEIRICLRLENLFSRMGQCLKNDSAHSSHAAISTLSHLSNATDRNDLCSKLHKLSMQQLSRIKGFADSPAVDLTKLNTLMQAINHDAVELKRNSQKPGEKLRQNHFFNGIRQQLNSPNGLATYDSPQYSLWLRQPSSVRQECLEGWMDDFSLLKRVVTRNLELIRGNREIKQAVTERGLFEQPMDKSRPCLLVRVKVDAEETFYPTISVGRHQINVQLQKIDDITHSLPQKSYAELPLTLHFCYS